VPDAPPKILPYSYFRAEGISLDAIETVQGAKRELDEMQKQLCKRFGANDMMGGYDKENDNFRFMCFHFTPAQEGNVPADWKINNRQMDNDGKSVVAIFAEPAPATKDHFFVTDFCGLMLRAAKRSKLENVLKCGDMPMKELPAGRYHGAFVRDCQLEAGGMQPNIGQIRDNVTFCFGSNSAIKGSDPVDAMQMMGNWYLRVPNDETGKPRFTPPDAVEVPLPEMLALDKQERAARFARTQARSFDPHI